MAKIFNLTTVMLFLMILFSCKTAQYSIPEEISIDPRSTVNEKLSNELQNLLNESVNDYELPAIQCAVILENGLRWVGIAGTTDFSRKTLAPPNSLFRIASATKLFTAVLLLKLYEDGHINLDDTIDTWYPMIQNANKITIKMLLNHTSGLPDTFENFSTLLISGIYSNKKWNEIELISRHNGSGYFEPGSDWKYSNANYIVLGLIIEKVTGKSLEQNYIENIFRPLSLNETFYQPNTRPSENLLSGFDRSLMPYPNKHNPNQTSWSSLAVGSGAMVSSANDMASFMYALFNGKILKNDTINEMRNFLPTKDAGGKWTGYGLGLVRVEINGEEYLGHEGLFIGFQSYMLYSVNNKNIIAIVSNKSKYQQEELIIKIISKIEK
jgi:D-alanyl-D-alanine carboxypeptidase